MFTRKQCICRAQKPLPDDAHKVRVRVLRSSCEDVTTGLQLPKPVSGAHAKRMHHTHHSIVVAIFAEGEREQQRIIPDAVVCFFFFSSSSWGQWRAAQGESHCRRERRTSSSRQSHVRAPVCVCVGLFRLHARVVVLSIWTLMAIAGLLYT